MLPGKWRKENDGKSEKNDIGGERGEDSLKVDITHKIIKPHSRWFSCVRERGSASVTAF